MLIPNVSAVALYVAKSLSRGKDANSQLYTRRPIVTAKLIKREGC